MSMKDNVNRRRTLRIGAAIAVAGSIICAATAGATPAMAQQQQKPNIVIIWGDDIGQSNISAYSRGLMGYKTPNIDRIATEGMMFTDYYGEQSCTAGRASFITGQSGLRTGMTKVGLPGATLGLQKEDPTIAEMLKPLGYATGQFGKNHLGDRNDFLPTVHGSTSSTAIFTTSTPKKNRSCRIIRKTRRFVRNTGHAACWTAKPPILTIRRSIRVSEKSASKFARTPVR